MPGDLPRAMEPNDSEEVLVILNSLKPHVQSGNDPNDTGGSWTFRDMYLGPGMLAVAVGFLFYKANEIVLVAAMTPFQTGLIGK